jgi:hypothetical protein
MQGLKMPVCNMALLAANSYCRDFLTSVKATTRMMLRKVLILEPLYQIKKS